MDTRVTARKVIWGSLLVIACSEVTVPIEPTSGSSTSVSSASTTAGTGGAGVVSSSTSTSSTAGAGGDGSCGSMCAPLGLDCCAGKCVNKKYDVLNCGACGSKCQGEHPHCNGGKCGQAPCAANGPKCVAPQFCCWDKCCAAGQLCCFVPIGGGGAYCTDPATHGGTCDPGCPACPCAAPNTPIATPRGERPIAELTTGDLVYSIHMGRVQAVPVVGVQRHVVSHHHVARVALDNGQTLLISAGHPLADDRNVGDLQRGDSVHGIGVVSIERVDYPFDATHDILPASDTGTYFAARALIGSTMFGPTRVPAQCFVLPLR